MIRYFLFVVVLLVSICRGDSFAQTETPFWIGADVSFLSQLETAGAQYSDDGFSEELLSMLKRHGVNSLRLRLWHTPVAGHSALDEVLAMAKRIEAAGFALLLDFHYSDTWADPGRQTKPAAWDGASFEVLQDSVYQYSYQVITRLRDAGISPAMVQVGNEIIQGMLWDDGRVGGAFDTPSQWQNLSLLLGKGIQGIQDALDEADPTRIMIHIDRGADLAGARWFFDNLVAQELNFDAIGLSYYPWWHGTLEAFDRTIDDLAGRYEKPVYLVETAYPWTLNWFDNTNNIVGLPEHVLPGYPATPAGQAAFMRDVIQTVKAVPEDRGKGVFYWAPEYVAVPGVGSPWENVTLFDFTGAALEALDALAAESTVNIEAHEESKIEVLEPGVYPNPFGGQATLTFSLQKNSRVSASIYRMDGKRVARLLDERIFPSGRHHIEIDGRDLPPGIYLCRIASQRTGRLQSVLLVRR